MSKNCQKCRKALKVSVKEKPEVIQDTPLFNNFLKTFDMREKRISIVFKVIYVIAVLFASVFMLVSKERGKGLFDLYIGYVCLSAFLIQLLYRMVVYIFNELKCLKIKSDEIEERERRIIEKQISKTEHSYARIFNYFSVGGMASIFAGIALLYIQKNVTRDILMAFSFIGSIVGAVIGTSYHKKHISFWQSLCSIVWTLTIIALLAAMAFEVVS